jgi:hypothetical protein
LGGVAADAAGTTASDASRHSKMILRTVEPPERGTKRTRD